MMMSKSKSQNQSKVKDLKKKFNPKWTKVYNIL